MAATRIHIAIVRDLNIFNKTVISSTIQRKVRVIADAKETDNGISARDSITKSMRVSNIDIPNSSTVKAETPKLSFYVDLFRFILA